MQLLFVWPILAHLYYYTRLPPISEYKKEGMISPLLYFMRSEDHTSVCIVGTAYMPTLKWSLGSSGSCSPVRLLFL